ncbi:sensor histidine kinase [Paenibacillus pedocola]|uniref:sensor histidine kinase n=1 Tax=Paenibacillus pedocola TaxID=3242193 RepID=UPI0028774E11|nr:sensor histidine kinase [Paenibacillus typhae]
MYFIRMMNDMRMKKKLAFTFISVAILPLLLSGLYLTGKLREIVINNAFMQVSDNVDRVRKRTEELIKVPLDISYRLSVDNRMKKVASREYANYGEVIQAYREYTDIRDYIQLYKEISGIRIYVENPTALNNWEFIQPGKSIMDQTWYREAIDQKGLAGWNLIKDEQSDTESISLIRSFPVDAVGKKGVLVINVDQQQLSSILDQESFTTLIVDSRNRIVGSNEAELTGMNLPDIKVDEQILLNQEGSYNTVVKGKDSKVVIADLNPPNSWNGLRVISIITVAGITREADQVILLGAVVIMVSLLFAVLLIYASATLLSRRMLRLSKHMAKVGSGSWETYIHIDGKDEVGLLSKQFNTLLRSVHDLVQEVQETNAQKNLIEQRQSEIRFKMLASQIHPHFLFNSLESIRMEAHIRRQDDIAEAVWLLSTLLRSSLEAGSGNIPLREEIERVRCYLDMQKFRYEDRLEYHLTVDPDLQELPVPPLIIQPLVENSILHGLDNREEGAVITVEVKKIPEGALIKVFDNGAGFPPERLAGIRAELAEDVHEEESERIGMRNVNDRLVLMYGESSALRIESQPETGTTITFFIPGGVDND